MIVLGIDPGTVRCGWGVVERSRGSYRSLAFGCIEPTKKDSASRLLHVYTRIMELIERYKPDYIGVEQLFFSKNVKTAMSIAEVRGVIILAITQKKIRFCEHTPYQIKQAVCGYGNADKKQVQSMVQKLLNLDKMPTPDDAADGLAIALMQAQTNLNLKSD